MQHFSLPPPRCLHIAFHTSLDSLKKNADQEELLGQYRRISLGWPVLSLSHQPFFMVFLFVIVLQLLCLSCLLFSTFKKPNERLSQRFPLLFDTLCICRQAEKRMWGLSSMTRFEKVLVASRLFISSYLPHLLDDPCATSDFNQSKISSRWLFHIV